jgi:hypothetical protein
MVFGFTVYAMDESIRPIRPDIIMRPICFFFVFFAIASAQRPDAPPGVAIPSEVQA